jgi:hypothetical protein
MFHAYHAVDHDCKAIMALNMRIQQTYVQKGLALPSSSPDASTQTNVTGRATNSIPTDEILKQYSHHVYQLFRTAHVRLTYCPLLPPPLPKATREISCQTEEAEGDLHHSHLVCSASTSCLALLCNKKSRPSAYCGYGSMQISMLGVFGT